MLMEQAPPTARLMLTDLSELHSVMHLLIYNLLKTSHDANAVDLADNSRDMTQTTRILCSLASRVDELATHVGYVEQNQHALSNRLDTGLTVVRADISRAIAANHDSLHQRSLEDLREIIVRGIPPTVHDSLHQRSLEDPREIIVRGIPPTIQLDQ